MRSEGGRGPARDGEMEGDLKGEGKRGSGGSGRKGGQCVGAGWKRAQEEEDRNGRGTWPWMGAGFDEAARRR